MRRAVSFVSGLLPILFLLALAAGCRRAAVWPPAEPAAVKLGEEVCAHCRMIVSDGRYGGQRHLRGGGVEHFDDLGCLLAADAGRTPADGIFVRSFSDEHWVRGDRAFVVKAADIGSPMGYGLAAFDSREAAEREAAKHAGATVTPFTGLRQGE